MHKPKIRIPYREITSPAFIIPERAQHTTHAVESLRNFLLGPTGQKKASSVIVLSGAGISVASGLADYRGPNGTYRVNAMYRPTYHNEFVTQHSARRRYWARSFLGWSSLCNSKPNAGHNAIKDLGDMGIVTAVITQNVDSLHLQAHPAIPILELHGYLRAVVCISCRQEMPRDIFQAELARLNPLWAEFLGDMEANGIRWNPDGDVDVPGAPYSTFRYPACPKCLENPPFRSYGHQESVTVDPDGAWSEPSSAGILKPAVIMFGENLDPRVRQQSEHIIRNADKLLVLGTSLATFSAWRLARLAKDMKKPIAMINLGGVRGEQALFEGISRQQSGSEGVRVDMSTDFILPLLVEAIRRSSTMQAPIPDLAGKHQDLLL